MHVRNLVRMRGRAGCPVIGRIVATVSRLSYEVPSLQQKQTSNSDSSLRDFIHPPNLFSCPLGGTGAHYPPCVTNVEWMLLRVTLREGSWSLKESPRRRDFPSKPQGELYTPLGAPPTGGATRQLQGVSPDPLRVTQLVLSAYPPNLDTCTCT